MIESMKNVHQKSFSLFQGIIPINRSTMLAEVIAGITLAALAIPEVMGYTKISGTPVITGLYTLLIPMLLYVIFGSSRHLVVAADSATAAILAAALVGMADTGSHEYVALAGFLALMSAGLLFLARFIGLGFMADFLSRTVLIGFLTGVGIHIAIGQIPGMLGIDSLREISRMKGCDLVISIVVIAIIQGARNISEKIPGALIAVVGAIFFSCLFNLESFGINTLGEIPKGLPLISFPDVHWSLELFQKLLPTAFSMLVVILAQSAATSRAYAAKYNESFNENVDLIGLGMANLGAALSGAFVVNGSPTKTQMVNGAGGRSQLSQLVTVFIVFLVLMFFTKPLSHMPSAVLSTVVFLIGLQLVDVQGMQKVWIQRPAEFWVALMTTVVVIFIGVEQGIVIAMFLSLLEHVRRSYRSQNVILTLDVTHHWKLLPVNTPEQAKPGLLLYRFAHTIYYANSQQFFDQIIGFVNGAKPSLKWLCIDASAIADIDFSAAETLRQVYFLLKERGVRIVWAHVTDMVKLELDRYEITELMGEDCFYEHMHDVVDDYIKRSS